jgi:hypothetical protein
MADKDEISIEAKDAGISLKSSGEAAGRLTNALTDLISPLTESAGYFGDRIRLYRIGAVITALQTAHAIAKERGSALRPVPPKFLVQWLENASLEGETSANLSELWAKLLVSASDGYKSSHISCIDLLKKIGPDEAKLLQYFAHDTNPDYSLYFDILSQRKDYLQAIVNIIKEGKLEDNPKWGEVLNMADGVALQFNYRLLYLHTHDMGFLPTSFFRDNERSVSMLEREGALNIRRGRCNVLAVSFQLCWIELTKFGFDFVWECEKS